MARRIRSIARSSSKHPAATTSTPASPGLPHVANLVAFQGAAAARSGLAIIGHPECVWYGSGREPQTANENAADDRQRTFHQEGQLDRRLRHAVARLADDHVFDETFVLQDLARTADYNRQFEEWAGDLSGRYIGTLAACAAYTGEQYPRLHRVARAIPGFQRPTGLVGTDQPLDIVDFRVIWGQGRLLAGLIDYHLVFPLDDVLACARHLGDSYARSAPTWSAPKTRAHPDFAYYTQAIEGLVGLYRATGQESQLASAHAMGMLWLSSSAERADTGQHSHGFLLTLLGLLDLYETTSQNLFLQTVQEGCVTRIASEDDFCGRRRPSFSRGRSAPRPVRSPTGCT